MEQRLSGMRALFVAALSLGVAYSASGQVLLPKPGEPLLLDAGRQPIRVVLVADGLVGPWDIEFLPDGETMLVTESPGRLRIIRDGELVAEPVWEAPSPDGNDVLHGLAVHPDFNENGYVYTILYEGRRRGPDVGRIARPPRRKSSHGRARDLRGRCLGER